MEEIFPVREPSFRLPSFRLPDASPLSDQEHLERRQFFLRSYLFSREPLQEKPKERGRLCRELRSFFRLRRIIWSRLRPYFGSRRRHFPSRRAPSPPSPLAHFYEGRTPPASKQRLSDFISV